MKKAIFDQKAYDVINICDAYKFKDRMVCCEVGEYILPVYATNNTSKPGIHVMNKEYARVVQPSKSEEKQYLNTNVVNFSDLGIKEFIANTEVFAQEQKNRIANDSGEVHTANITENTSPAMAAMQEAFGNKEMIIDSYSERFEPGKFNNHKNSIKKDEDVTLKKIILWGQIFDLNIDIVITDKGGDIANPMGEDVVITRRIT